MPARPPSRSQRRPAFAGPAATGDHAAPGDAAAAPGDALERVPAAVQTHAATERCVAADGRNAAVVQPVGGAAAPGNAASVDAATQTCGAALAAPAPVAPAPANDAAVAKHVAPASSTDDAAPAYAELHCLSNFSFLRGASHPEELVARAAELGYTALALTDWNSLAGIVRAHLAAKEHGLHLLVGAKITPIDAPPVVLLAPDRAAYARLARLITRGRVCSRKGACTLRLAQLAEFCSGAGLIAIALPPPLGPAPASQRQDAPDPGPLRGVKLAPRPLWAVEPSYPFAPQRTGESQPLSKMKFTARDPGVEVAAGRDTAKGTSRSPDTAAVPLPPAEPCLIPTSPPAFPASLPPLDPPGPAVRDPWSVYRHIFGRDLYLAAELVADVPDHQRLQELTSFSRQVGIPLVAANAVHYHAPARRYLQDVLTCIREKCTVATAGTRLFANAERHLRPRDEIARRYAGYPELVRRTVAIARRCAFSLDELCYEYPHELVPPGLAAHAHLAELTWSGARERYPAGIPAKVHALLTKELGLIAELKYEHYFLTVWDLVRYARSRGILCQGRGSAANSAVCYCLGVTAVDPARIDLLFERFISRERNEPPDIDVDFEHERREEVFQYIYEKYGRERAAITAEVISYRPRSAVRDVGKALGMSLDRVDVLAKALDWWSAEAVPEDALRAAGLDPQDRTVQMIVRLVRQLLGFPRHLSQHVGGFVITETPLCEIVPLENGAMPGRTFIEWDKDDIDALGILKVDCLALGMLTAISRCFGLLGQYYSGTGNRERGTADTSAGPLPESRERENCHGGDDISGFARVAARNPIGSECLPSHTAHADERALCPHQPDPARSRIDPQQHRGGQRALLPEGLPAFSDDCARQLGGTRDATDHRRTTGVPDAQRRTMDSLARGHAHATGTNQQPEAILTGSGMLAQQPICRSPFPVPRSLSSVPPEDPRVYDLICAADTVGVFQIESRAQMSMLPRLRPRNYYDLVIEVAIVRPGPIQGGMIHPYLRRRNGEEPVWYPSDAVRRVLEKTLGVPLFQEQVMQLAVVAAGFTPGEADRLRRLMAAWRRVGQLEQMQTRLVQGMLANGYSPAFAEQIYQQIRGFGEYGFPESHSASFALLVYVSAWLKLYHPAAFCGALLNAQPMGFYAPAQLVRDAQEHGVVVRPVDINASSYDCTLEGGAPPELRLGFRLVRGLSPDKVRGVELARAAGPIRSIRRLARCPDVSRDTLVRLAAADAFRSLGLSRRAALWQILALEDEPAPLFADLDPVEPAAPLPPMPLDEVVAQDYHALGLSLNAHPVALVRPELNALRLGGTRPLTISPAAALRHARHGQRIAVAGLVTHRQRPGTAAGIVFMTLEDETDHANLIIRPQIWDRDRAVGRAKIALIAEGHVERQGAVIHVQVARLHDLSARLGPLRAKSRDFH